MTAMSLQVTVSVDRGATVLRLRGTADAALVVVDLDETTAAAPEALRDLVRAVASDPSRVHVVARRNSLVGLLVQARVHHLVGVHRSLADAIAAHRARRW